MEKRHLTKLLTEERIWYCTLVRDYQGVMVSMKLANGNGCISCVSFWYQNVGISMIGDLERLQVISQELSVTIQQPTTLPEKTLDYITEMCPLSSHAKMNDFQGTFGVIYDNNCLLPCFHFRFTFTWDSRFTEKRELYTTATASWNVVFWTSTAIPKL